MNGRALVISFSGGQTSAYMAKWCIENLSEKYDRVITIFANTGQEREETLDFVNSCDKHFGLGVVWVEAEACHGERKGSTAKVVSYETASRDGAPFEEMIKKYGIPNKSYPHCTRELKIAPINAYLKNIGLKRKMCDMAIGIRVDEFDRVQEDYKEKNIIYPLAFMHPTTKGMVADFWRRQPFQLGLKDYQGNCAWCWKKSDRKLFTLIKESPEIFDFPARMEKEYPTPGKEVFFRNHRSVADMFAEYQRLADEFLFAGVQLDLFDPELDIQADCADSCEAA